MRLGLAVSVLCLAGAACAAPDLAINPEEPAPIAKVWQFDEQADALRAASCSADNRETQAVERLQISAVPVSKGSDEVVAGAINIADGADLSLDFSGAWHLTADHPSFGGLSGLAVKDEETLLAVTDAGAWVTLDLEATTGAPASSGTLGYMYNRHGEFLSGKLEADAEGLAYRDGLALVSFERDHRVEAFDLGGCGMAARAVQVARFPKEIGDKNIPGNQGPEALSFGPKGQTLVAGFEFRGEAGSPAGTLKTDGYLVDAAWRNQVTPFLLTGMDQKKDLMVEAFRAYDPVRGARVRVSVWKDQKEAVSIFIKEPLPVDNFEGIAIGKSPEGGQRIWLISDDNFRETQRTLLLAFDLN